MAITKMNKFTLICFRENKKSVLRNLQTFGNSQIINLQSETNNESPLEFMSSESVDDEIKNVEANLAALKSSLSFLGTYSPKTSAIKAMKDGKSEISYEELHKYVESCKWDDVCRELKSKEARINEIGNEITRIKGEIEILEPWSNLDVAFSQLQNNKSINVYTGIVKVKDENQLVDINNSFSDELSLSKLHIVNKLNKDVYIVVFAHVSQVKEVEELLKRYEYSDVKILCADKVNEKIEHLEAKLVELSKDKEDIIECLKADDRLELLEKCEEYFANAKERLECSRNFIGSKNTVVISGWVPEELNDDLNTSISVATDNKFVLSFEAVGEDEDLEVPVKLKNNGFASAFESITEMYSLPNYKGIDPTPWLAPFYMIFFGMMVADIGYGLLVTIAALIGLKKFNLDESKKKFAKLFVFLGLSTTAWGLIYGAGFGDFISFKSILSQNDDIFTIMYLSIGFGVFQILMGLGIKAAVLIKSKKYFTAFSEVGLWLITFAGIAMAALGSPIGMWVMIAGMVGIVLTNGGDAKSIGGKLGNGAYALYGITNYVGDLISYTRLMALGIAGGSIAGAMNLIIGYLPGVAIFVIGPVLFILLHVFNLLLGLLGAYVHSCRLQYVEYFGKFYEGGGEAFKPLKMRNKHINVK